MKTVRRLLLCLMLLMCFAAAGEAEDLSVTWSEALRGFQENTLTVTCPGNGTVRLTVLDPQYLPPVGNERDGRC